MGAADLAGTSSEAVSRLLRRLTHDQRYDERCWPMQHEPSELFELCRLAGAAFVAQPPLLHVEPPICVCGDVHGQFDDLLEVFAQVGAPPHRRYLFLGDYVDRGPRGVDTIALLFALKLTYPDCVYLLRGNHECADINQSYGFKDEIDDRFDIDVQQFIYTDFIYAFDQMPVAALIADAIFCAHGGISPTLQNFYQIESVKRPLTVPPFGIVTDLLWADPDTNNEARHWGQNNRGISFTFSKRNTKRFCRQHDVELICRAHQVIDAGYELAHKSRTLTVFTAPNYCGSMRNDASVLHVDEQLKCRLTVLRTTISVRRSTSAPTLVSTAPSTTTLPPTTETDSFVELCLTD